MWGPWLGISLGGALIIALGLGLVVGASPLIAVVIAGLIGAAVIGFAALRRGDDAVAGKPVSREGDVAATTAKHGSRHGAPAGGDEGMPPERR